jgi:glycosyltransferase involved in cell wall biosynthesis
MTHTAQERLVRHYAVDPATVRVVPHGAVDNRGQQGSLSHLALGTGRVVLTWGLLGYGKGIEWGIEAMAHLTDLRPPVRYHIVGETHPKVLQRSGERYREGLVRRAGELGVEDQVHFENRYVGSQELPAIIQRADVVLLPYDSCEQVTSGVLVEEVTAGKPVVSTDFPHARELLSGGAGLLVSRKNPVEMAGALRRVLTDRALASRMRAEADRLAPNLLWPAVAAQYRDTAAKALTRQQVGFSA